MTLLGSDNPVLVLDRASRELAYLDVEADRDLTDLGLEVAVGDQPFEAWQWAGPGGTTGADTGQRWQRTARRMLAGPEAPDPGDALVLAVDLHTVRWRLTGTSESPVRRAAPIEVA